MKNKLFLSLSILTSAFALQASPSNTAYPVEMTTAKQDELMKAYELSPAETRFERVRAIADEKLALTKIALGKCLIAAQKNTVNGYQSAKGFVIANPKKSAGIALGSAALVGATVYLYKNGYFKNPFAKAAKPVVKAVEVKEVTPAAVKPVNKQVAKTATKKVSRSRRAINKIKAKFARKK